MIARRSILQVLLGINGAAVVTPMATGKQRPEKVEVGQRWSRETRYAPMICLVRTQYHDQDTWFVDRWWQHADGLEWAGVWTFKDIDILSWTYLGMVEDLPGGQR